MQALTFVFIEFIQLLSYNAVQLGLYNFQFLKRLNVLWIESYKYNAKQQIKERMLRK